MAAFELVSEIKNAYDVRLHHRNSMPPPGWRKWRCTKTIEAGVDGVDTAAEHSHERHLHGRRGH